MFKVNSKNTRARRDMFKVNNSDGRVLILF